MKTIGFDVPFGLTNYGQGSAPAWPPALGWLKVGPDGRMTDGTRRVGLYGSCTIGCSSAPETDDEVDMLVARMASKGFNHVRFDLAGRKWLEVNPNPGYGNWGMMAHAVSEGATDNSFHPTALARMDRMIWRCSQAGIYVSLSNNSYAAWFNRLGLPQGSQWGTGLMFLLPRARRILFDALEPLLTHRNHYTGLRNCDEPCIVDWQFDNEHGLLDTLRRGDLRTFGSGLPGSTQSETHWFDQIPHELNGNGYWRPECDAYIASYYAARGWPLPGGRWPDYAATVDRAIFTTGPDGGWERWLRFIADTERDSIRECIDWLRSFNPRLGYVAADNAYVSTLALLQLERDNVSVGYHIYMPAWDSTASTGTYKQRGSILSPAMTVDGKHWYNGGLWGYMFTGYVPGSFGQRISEDGSYGDSRWTYEGPLTQCVVGLLGDIDNISTFCLGQQKQWVRGLDKSGLNIHCRMRKPGYELAEMCAAPIFQHRMLDPLPRHVTRVTEAQLLSNIGSGTPKAANFQPINRHRFLKRESRFELAATSNTATDPQPTGPLANWAEFQASTVANPIAITRNADGSIQVGLHANGWTLHKPGRVAGWINEIPANASIGPLATGAMIEPLPNAYLILRPDGDWPVMTRRTKLFFASHDFQLDAAGFSLTEDGAGASGTNQVTTWGTFENIRARQPEATDIAIVSAADQTVRALRGDGTLAEVVSTWTDGVLRLRTSPEWPVYVLDEIVAPPPPPPPPPPNVAPTVILAAPASATVGAPVTLSASASDSDGTIAKVEFFDGAALIGADTSSPYSLSWTPATVGTHSLTARATDNRGAVTTSSAVSVSVSAPPPPPPKPGKGWGRK